METLPVALGVIRPDFERSKYIVFLGANCRIDDRDFGEVDELWGRSVLRLGTSSSRLRKSPEVATAIWIDAR